MRTRIISAAVAVVIAIVALILHKTFIFELLIGLITASALYEIFRATKYGSHKLQSVICYAYAFVNTFIEVFHRHGWLTRINDWLILGCFVTAMCLSYLKHHKEYDYNDLFFMMGLTALLSLSFKTLLYMSSNGRTNGEEIFMLVITLCAAWLADSGAYFAGTFFGKTKLCPEISPKKTVEGLIGGIISNGALLLLIGLVYDKLLGGSSLNYLFLFIAGMLCAVIGLIGDLTASEIKRQCGIKDYGNVMPGHGGVMDRFDSVLLVAPFMYYLFTQGLILK